ncbi:MAG: hypothetical protein GXO75_07320 [Calditrichaeota bacterium]|nr:hypothetical protein [Calditrichota bacterium]
MALNRPVKHPALIYYYDGYCKEQMEKIQEAAQSFAAGMNEPVDYVFPYRRKALDVFQAALRYNPEDARAHYYSGIYAGILNGKQAVSHWKTAVELEPENADAWRDLGLLFAGYPGITKDLKQSIRYYEKAFEIAPADPLILAELDKVYKEFGLKPQKRLAFLKKHRKLVELRDDLLSSMLDLMVQNREYKDALEVCSKHNFNNWEGYYQIHNSYVEACVQMAKSEKTPEEALQMYRRACQYPRNLKVAPRYPDLRGFLYYPMALLYKKIGITEKADSLLKITANESTHPPSLASYYQALALRELGRAKDADQVLETLKIEGQKLVDGTSKGYEQRSISFQQALGYFYLSMVYLAKNDSENAEIILKKAHSFNTMIEQEALTRAQRAFTKENEY